MKKLSIFFFSKIGYTTTTRIVYGTPTWLVVGIVYCRASHTGDATRVMLVVRVLVLFMCSVHARARLEHSVIFFTYRSL